MLSGTDHPKNDISVGEKAVDGVTGAVMGLAGGALVLHRFSRPAAILGALAGTALGGGLAASELPETIKVHGALTALTSIPLNGAIGGFAGYWAGPYLAAAGTAALTAYEIYQLLQMMRMEQPTQQNMTKKDLSKQQNLFNEKKDPKQQNLLMGLSYVPAGDSANKGLTTHRAASTVYSYYQDFLYEYPYNR